MTKSLIIGTRTISRAEKKHLVGLLECGDFTEAKTYADELLAKGIDKSQINPLGYEIANRLRFTNKEFVERMTKAFEEYYWPNWLR